MNSMQLELPYSTAVNIQADPTALRLGVNLSRPKQLRLPHPIPYQGSKRSLAPRILALLPERRYRRFIEPFAGSGAMTIAAANSDLAGHFVINDSLEPLMRLWNMIINDPVETANGYKDVWLQQLDSDSSYYDRVRDGFNRENDPIRLLYLLARCVKNSPRFNQDGKFNQSADKRRLGMRPDKMWDEVLGVSSMLKGRTTVLSGDFTQTLGLADETDLVYMDPPYFGTTQGTDKRYHQGLHPARLIKELESLNARGVPFVLSYDGSSGPKTYGSKLPLHLKLTRFELDAGRSTQATLNGNNYRTIESLYVSDSLLR